MSPMSPGPRHRAPSHPSVVARVAAAALVALLASAWLTVSVSPSARAADDSVTASDGRYSVTVYALQGNAGSEPGSIGPGDPYSVHLKITNLVPDAAIISWEFEGRTWTPAYEGTTNTTMYWGGFYTNASQYSPLGSGPYLGTGLLTYKVGDNVMTLVTPAPPLDHVVATPPLSVQTTPVLTEAHSTTDGLAVMGDTVAYNVTITNTASVDITVESAPGLSAPVVVPAGGFTSASLPAVQVTYGDMLAGAYTRAAAAVSWSSGPQTGSVDVTYAPVPTEAIDRSHELTFSSSFTHADQSPATVGSLVEGDLVQFSLDLTNTGNLAYDYWSVQRTDLGAGLIATSSTLHPGESASMFPGIREYLRAPGIVFAPIALTEADIAAGYVDVPFKAFGAPTGTIFSQDQALWTTSVTKRVLLREWPVTARLVITATLNDTNGDGIGQAGETVELSYDVTNLSPQPVMFTNLRDAAGSDVAWLDGFSGTTPLRTNYGVGGVRQYTITAADQARGSINWGAAVEFTGETSQTTESFSKMAASIPTGAYKAPAVELGTTATFDDDNGDGFPSIGETVHLTTTLRNVGAYNLIDASLTDAGIADAPGGLFSVPGAMTPQQVEASSWDYVITADDFARGSFTYAAALAAVGLEQPLVGDAAVLDTITFQAYATDLDGVSAGGIAVCDATGKAATRLAIGQAASVKPGTCYDATSAAGYTVVAFSEPMTLATGSFGFTIPGELGVGAHRFALYAPDGTLVGYQNVTLIDPVAFAGDGLASTGADNEQLSYIAGGGAALVLLGSAMLIGTSRLRRREA